MPRKTPAFACTACGESAAQWAGRCRACGAMNTIVEVNQREAVLLQQERHTGGTASLATVGLAEAGSDSRVERFTSGEAELDRVLGGGLASGSAVVIGGEPGIGKSTLLAQVAGACAVEAAVCYVSAEESTGQVRDRFVRLGREGAGLRLASESDCDAIVGAIRSGSYRLVVVDSIQLLNAADIDGIPGSPSQVRGCAGRLVEAAKATGTTLVIVGHVTKEGTLAGPRLLEHLVDTVLHFEGDRYQELRSLRALKNRFGATGEVGLFAMTGTGLAAVADPAGIFIADRDAQVPGSCVTPVLDGSRCFLVEVQALVNPSDLPQPQRRVSGCDANRVAMILAVLSRRLRLPLGSADVFINVTGGARVREPAADLAVALAVASAWREVAVPPDLVAIGEVGLGGELRPAARYDIRASEARRLGFKRLLGPGPGKGKGRLKTGRLAEAIDLALGPD